MFILVVYVFLQDIRSNSASLFIISCRRLVLVIGTDQLHSIYAKKGKCQIPAHPEDITTDGLYGHDLDGQSLG